MEVETDKDDDDLAGVSDKPKHFIDKIKGIKHLDILVAILVLLIVLFIYFGVFGDKKNKIVSSSAIDGEFLHEIEHVLSNIDGVGRTEVIINYDDNRTQEIAQKVENVIKVDKDGVSHIVEENKSPIIIRGDGGDTPIVLSESKGNIKGVIVVASGGGNVKTKLAIIDALSTFLDIDADKIKVFERRKY